MRIWDLDKKKVLLYKSSVYPYLRTTRNVCFSEMVFEPDKWSDIRFGDQSVLFCNKAKRENMRLGLFRVYKGLFGHDIFVYH